MWKSIFITTFIAGTLDITAACVDAYLSTKITPDIVLRYVASGFFGKSAFAGGLGMMMVGLLFHFIIAFACTIIYFWLYPKMSFLKQNIALSSVLIGITAWFVTTIIIIPMSQITPNPFNFYKALIAVIILVVCIGFPIAYFAKRFFNSMMA